MKKMIRMQAGLSKSKHPRPIVVGPVWTTISVAISTKSLLKSLKKQS